MPALLWLKLMLRPWYVLPHSPQGQNYHNSHKPITYLVCAFVCWSPNLLEGIVSILDMRPVFHVPHFECHFSISAFSFNKLRKISIQIFECNIHWQSTHNMCMQNNFVASWIIFSVHMGYWDGGNLILNFWLKLISTY